MPVIHAGEQKRLRRKVRRMTEKEKAIIKTVPQISRHGVMIESCANGYIVTIAEYIFCFETTEELINSLKEYLYEPEETFSKVYENLNKQRKTS